MNEAQKKLYKKRISGIVPITSNDYNLMLDEQRKQDSMRDFELYTKEMQRMLDLHAFYDRRIDVLNSIANTINSHKNEIKSKGDIVWDGIRIDLRLCDIDGAEIILKALSEMKTTLEASRDTLENVFSEKNTTLKTILVPRIEPVDKDYSLLDF